MAEKIAKTAFAKINLGLDIIGRREDGYHLVRMIMQQIGLWDRLTFQKSDVPGIRLLVSEQSTLPDLEDMPVDDRNLIVRAARAVMERYGTRSGLEICLEKHIPMAAGMAGGSTDCAAALMGTAELFERPAAARGIGGNHRAGRGFTAHLGKSIRAREAYIQRGPALAVVGRSSGNEVAGIHRKGVAGVTFLVFYRELGRSGSGAGAACSYNVLGTTTIGYVRGYLVP